MEGVIIKDSKIHGKGVFADRNFTKGEIVVRHKLKELSSEEYNKLPSKEKCFVGIDGKKYLFFLPPARYVNHSCNPNTKVKGKADVAIRNIRKGEEITNYYRDDDTTFKMICNCGSKNCRGIIKNL
jgi:uncharacterized protein